MVYKLELNMKILKEEYAIGMAFLVRPWKRLTYKDVRDISGKKSKGYIYKALSRLMFNNIISTEQIGKSLLYVLNLDSLEARSYIGFLKEYVSWNEKHIPKRVIEDVSAKISTKFFIFLVTGSYAKKTQTKKSDLDIIIICDDSFDPKNIYAQISYAGETSIPLVHPYVFTKTQFLDMLLVDDENYGKEAARHNFIFSGGSEYYSILNEAIKRGFKG